jgi:hypothetical protein
MLHDVGWTDADVAGLHADWPAVTSSNLELFALIADGLAGMGADHLGGAAITPEQVRRWLLVLFVQRDRTTVASDRAVAWVEGTTLNFAAHNAVWIYGMCAGGEHDLGLLAFSLGICTGDLSAMRQAGPVDPDALRVLAGLTARLWV